MPQQKVYLSTRYQSQGNSCSQKHDIGLSPKRAGVSSHPKSIFPWEHLSGYLGVPAVHTSNTQVASASVSGGWRQYQKQKG